MRSAVRECASVRIYTCARVHTGVCVRAWGVHAFPGGQCEAEPRVCTHIRVGGYTQVYPYARVLSCVYGYIYTLICTHRRSGMWEPCKAKLPPACTRGTWVGVYTHTSVPDSASEALEGSSAGWCRQMGVGACSFYWRHQHVGEWLGGCLHWRGHYFLSHRHFFLPWRRTVFIW